MSGTEATRTSLIPVRVTCASRCPRSIGLSRSARERKYGANTVGYPGANDDERELLLTWLAFLRESILMKLGDLDEQQARWRPNDRLVPIAGVVFHLTEVEERWIEAAYLGNDYTAKQEDEFTVDNSLTVDDLATSYRQRGLRTELVVRGASDLADRCRRPWALEERLDLRWVLLHLLEETARHAGHADATRELLDGVVGL